ncbi:MAG: hypothetical protein CVU50_05005 [Candidatus Cloacimonetes bacterium HGW-Cloacimonetes-3]|jgi:O-antigen ligase|nr:MAG: hypothetical protein CVU50_05005 [Candidatus Cloacimonetes bacterium HGW-Cloacimonetes-3]
MKIKTINNSYTGIASLAIIVASVAVGYALQMISLSLLIRATGILGLWLLGILLKGSTLPRSLVIISSLYILPFELAFYFSLALLCLSLIADIYYTGQRHLLISYPISFVVLTVFGIIGLTKTYVQGGVLYFVATIVVPLISFIVIGNSRSEKPALEVWMRIISIVAAIVSVIGIYLALTNPHDRIGSTWSNAMTINGFYALAFFFCLALAFKSLTSTSRLIWLLTAVIIFFGMLFTYTRMAMLAVVFGLLMLMFKYRNIRLWGIIGIGLIPMLIPSAMMNRGSVGSVIDISILIRLIAWYNAGIVIVSHPFTGIGFSTWRDMYYNMIPLPMLYAQHAHNVYLNLLLEIGIFGALAYFVIIYKSLRTYYRKAVKPNKDMVAYCVWVGMLSLLFSCLTDIFIQQYTVSLLFWITLALMVKESSAEPEQNPSI